MIRLTIASLVSAVVLFVWGFIFWAALPLPFLVMSVPANEAEILAALQKADLKSGVYLIPWFSEEQAKSKGKDAMMEAVAKRQKEGPLVNITYRKEGADTMSPAIYAVGFAHFVLCSLVLAVLLRMALPGLETYASRVLFVFLAGVFASLMIDLGQPIWFHHPWCFPLLNAAYHVGFGLLAGLVLGALVRPQH